MSFKLDKKFLKSSHHIIDLKLCTIRLHDNSKFPWVILIPKRNKITDMSDLNSKFLAGYFFSLTTHTDDGHELSFLLLAII